MATDEPLQFDTAAPAGTPSASCAVCKKPLGDAYYTAGRAIVCASCKTRIETAPPARATALDIARSIVLGLGGAVLGAAIYYGVGVVIHGQIALVAIAVGWIVGRAVQLGARGHRGQVFQIIAVVLTYVGIALGYGPNAIAVYGVQVLSLPIRETFDSGIMGAVIAFIIAFGLYQAWIMNRDPGPPVFHGPFRVGMAA